MLQKGKVYVEVREADGHRFPYVDIGAGFHGRPSFRLWISEKLLSQAEGGKEFLAFPARAAVVKTEKGSLVLRPAEDKTTYNILVDSGFRGGAELEVLTPGAEVYRYEEYASPRGNLGISSGAIVVVPATAVLKVQWSRTGRLYGASAQGVTFLYPDGREETVDFLADGIEDFDQIKKIVKEVN